MVIKDNQYLETIMAYGLKYGKVYDFNESVVEYVAIILNKIDSCKKYIVDDDTNIYRVDDDGYVHRGHFEVWNYNEAPSSLFYKSLVSVIEQIEAEVILRKLESI